MTKLQIINTKSQHSIPCRPAMYLTIMRIKQKNPDISLSSDVWYDMTVIYTLFYEIQYLAVGLISTNLSTLFRDP